jgi:Ser-tRNA(Ala) deacylase AlaX
MTKLKYLSDSYLFNSEAIVFGIVDNEFGKAVILDETIFYPQGGGQPADRGRITSENGVFMIEDVRLDENGEVLHYGKFESGQFADGEKVKLEVDKDRRIINSRLHSAGHLLDCAVTKIGLNQLKPTKAYQFPEGPYVEYEGMIENPQEIIPRLQAAVDELVQKDMKVSAVEISAEEAVNKGVHVPTGKGARIVTFEGFEGCGCGGTHVRSSSEIGRILVRKIGSKKGATRISYQVI